MSKAQYTWQSNDGTIPLLLELQYEFTPASGLSPTVAVYRASDDYYVDWGSNTFKAPTASGTEFATMSEVQPGLYRKTFNPVHLGQIQPNQVYYIRYQATIPSGYVVDGEALASDINLIQTETHYFTELAGSGTLPQLGMTASFVPGGCR